MLMAWVGILAFAFQIYFDFSGYSDMAIGLGAMMGFRFPENFNYPYISESVTEFWRRWHMSLGQWFRDYVYIPLGGNRKGTARQVLNILIVWILTGIWHGAGWNFLLWGLWFAFFLILEKVFLGELLSYFPTIFGFLYMVCVVLCGWVIFAIEDVGSIMVYFKAMFGFGGVGAYNGQALYLVKEYGILLLVAAVAATPVGKMISEMLGDSGKSGAIAARRLFEKIIPALLLLASIAYIVDASYNPFLYFRF